jgi:hypothetical protein
LIFANVFRMAKYGRLGNADRADDGLFDQPATERLRRGTTSDRFSSRAVPCLDHPSSRRISDSRCAHKGARSRSRSQGSPAVELSEVHPAESGDVDLAFGGSCQVRDQLVVTVE